MARPAGLFEKYVNPIFVETGTYRGDSVQEALDVGFERVYTIELDDGRYEKCAKRFEGDSRVHLYHGDSIEELQDILRLVDQRATFWLDAHITAGTAGKYNCPLVQELEIIASHPIKSHTILIDDRRMLGGRRFGKVREEQVIEAIKKVNSAYQIHYEDGVGSKNSHVDNDIIVATV